MKSAALHGSTLLHVMPLVASEAHGVPAAAHTPLHACTPGRTGAQPCAARVITRFLFCERQRAPCSARSIEKRRSSVRNSKSCGARSWRRRAATSMWNLLFSVSFAFSFHTLQQQGARPGLGNPDKIP